MLSKQAETVLGDPSEPGSNQAPAGLSQPSAKPGPSGASEAQEQDLTAPSNVEDGAITRKPGPAPAAVTAVVAPTTPEPATPPTPDAFHYGDLDPALASTAQDAAKRIRSNLRTETLAAIEIGRDLLSIKELLPHGRFGMWIEAEFGWHERTAQRYMRAVEVFGAKPDIVSDLPLTIVHQLAAPSMPLAVRENVLARAVAGERLEPSAITAPVREAKAKGCPGKRPAPHRPEQPTVDEGTPGVPGGERSDQPQAATMIEEPAEHGGRRSVEAAEEAARIIIARLGSDLDRLAEMLERADPHELVRRLLSGLHKQHDAGGALDQPNVEGEHNSQPDLLLIGNGESVGPGEGASEAPASEDVSDGQCAADPGSAGCMLPMANGSPTPSEADTAEGEGATASTPGRSFAPPSIERSGAGREPNGRQDEPTFRRGPTRLLRKGVQ